jgi:hypothetical protein
MRCPEIKCFHWTGDSQIGDCDSCLNNGDEDMTTILCTDCDCPEWIHGRLEDDCDLCVDGRWIQETSEYASTCDGCADQTHCDCRVWDPRSRLFFCEACAKIRGLIPENQSLC